MFSEDYNNFHDLFWAVFEEFSLKLLTQEKALSLLKEQYQFDKDNVKDSYVRMYPDGHLVDYIDGLSQSLSDPLSLLSEDFQKGHFNQETFNRINQELEYWQKDKRKHWLKKAQKTDSRNIARIDAEMDEHCDTLMAFDFIKQGHPDDLNDPGMRWINNQALKILVKDHEVHLQKIQKTPEEVQTEKPPIPNTHPAYDKLLVIFEKYPKFKKQFVFLQNTRDSNDNPNPYITVTENTIVWVKSQQSLAEYFGGLKKPTKTNHSWKKIEELFNVKDLRHALSSNGNMFKNMSKDYATLLQLLQTSDL
jgi:uncharacterized protein YrzB (UPF0473 family)